MKPPWKWFRKDLVVWKDEALSETSSDRFVTILIAPSFDDLTRILAGWVKSLAQAAAEIVLLEGERASSHLFQITLAQRSTERLLVVFFGHGWFDSFLTAPHLGFGGERFNGRHSRLCIASHFDIAANVTVIAFCCKAAQEMGRLLAAREPPVKFLGFRDDLSFVIGTQAREEAFARPICTLVRKSLTTGTVDAEDVRSLANAYEAESLRWTSGDMASDPLALLVSGFLDEQRQLIEAKVFET